jgi:hypothetical protein
VLCKFCNNAPPIRESHVVPRAMGMYIKKNSPFGYMLNLWKEKPVFDLLKGPYFCAKCDNNVFGAWEGFFLSQVWKDPLHFNAKWTAPASINFVLLLAYRYAIHFLETSPIAAMRPYSEFIRDLAESAMDNNTLVGKSIFIYPYVHRAITNDCSLLPGVNHLLSLTIHGQSLPQEGDLPNAILVIVPKVIFLFSDRDLSGCNDNKVKNPCSLTLGGSFNATTANTDLPSFLYSVLNKIIGKSTAHQKQLGRWKRMAYGTDKLLNPSKVCYVAQKQDQDLLNWQKEKCL